MIPNPDYRPYAGIGSRRAPREILTLIAWPAQTLARNGFTLRSGGARGADSAFEYWHNATTPRPPEHLPIPPPEVYRPDSAPPWALALVQRYVDNGHRWDSFPDYKKGLLARNMQQILGRNGDSPALFVLYWTEAERFDTPAAGGTRYALRCAQDHGVPMLNLGRPGSSTATEILRWCREISTSQPTGTYAKEDTGATAA